MQWERSVSSKKRNILISRERKSVWFSFDRLVKGLLKLVSNLLSLDVLMCLKATTEIYEMLVCKKNMEIENVVVKPQKRKKIRRLKKRKYCALFGVEKRDENDVPLKQRKTKTAAPENTTQFIMADKEVNEPFFITSPSSSSPASHCTSSPGSVRGTPLSERDFAFDSSEEDLVQDFEELDFDLDFFQRDYEATYNRIQEESLLALSQNELVTRYIELEGKEELLLKRCQELTNDQANQKKEECSFSRENSSSTSATAHAVKLGEEKLLRQLEALQRENKSLKEENLRLKGFSSSTGLNRLS